MKVIYTRHSKGRMRWRKISKIEADQVINNPDHKEKIRDERFHYFRKIGKRTIRVTLVQEEGNFIILSVVDKSF